MRRLAFLLCLVVVWVAFGFGVNRLLSSRRSDLAAAHPVVAPPSVTPAFSLPGTIYVSQGGRLYRLVAGHFTELKAAPSTDGWIMPAAGPAGNLLAVGRGENWSDIYVLDSGNGAVIRQLTNNASPTKRVELNAWSFWPHLAADAKTAFFAYDGPKTGQSYQVDLAVWAGPLAGTLESRQWTVPNGYTGGDVSPVPMPGGGVLFARYGITPDSKVVSRLATVTRPGGPVVYLTGPDEDCGSPALSPDGNEVATICTSDTQSARLEILPLTNGAAGPARVLVPNCQCASPSWSPDGLSLLYLAPPDPSGRFQLWWIDRAAGAAPAPPRLLTSQLDLDATSPPAWVSG